MICLKTQDVVLFQGDSITHGGRGENQADKNHVLGHGFQTLLAGRLAMENLPRTPAFYNRGVSGDTTQKLLARWQRDTLDLSPTLLNILIGANNGSSEKQNEPELFASDLREMIARTRAAHPACRIVLSEPFAFPHPASHTEEALSRNRRRVDCTRALADLTRQIAEETGSLFVPLWETLDRYRRALPPAAVIWDTVHPTFLGHELIAKQWYETVNAVWGK